MTDPTFDGLCAVTSPFCTRDGLRLRCRFEMGHGGDHSWKKYETQFKIIGGVFHSDMVRWFYPKPRGCTCAVNRTTEGEIVEYVFRPDCPAHSAR